MRPSPPGAWTVEPDDPRAPPQEVWDRMSEDERARVVASLPSEFPLSESAPPEGDPHFDAKVNVRDVLGRFFRRIGRGVYIGAELPVYYPGEPMFAPDIMIVLDVDPRSRDTWVVSAEGRGIDVAIEIHYAGRRTKDLQRNVERYARLGIREYFVFEVRKNRLYGHRLAPERGVYRPILPQGGMYASEVLGLDLRIESGRIRFFVGFAPLADAEEVIARLDAVVDDLTAKNAESERRAEEALREKEELARRIAELEARLREKGGTDPDPAR